MTVLYLTMNPNRESTTVPTEGWFRLLRGRGLEPGGVRVPADGQPRVREEHRYDVRRWLRTRVEEHRKPRTSCSAAPTAANPKVRVRQGRLRW